MKKMIYRTLFLIFCLAIQYTFSQQLRFYYELSYLPCTKCIEKKTEINILSVRDNKSVFQSYGQLQKDSIFIDHSEQKKEYGITTEIGNIMIKEMNHTFIISKNYDSKELYFKDIVGEQSTIKYLEKEKLFWELKTEKDSINGYSCQKATSSFGGRIWTAWFTTNITIQDGPYKFWGLPGLIVEISDEKNEYVWKLIANKKIDSNNLQELNFMEYQGFEVTETTKGKLNKLRKLYEKNPMGDIRSMIEDMDMEGEKRLKEAESRMLKYYEENNNSIEIEKLKT